MSQAPVIPIERLNQICRTIASQVDCQISIMMDGGYVVASSVPGRQGIHHEGAARVLSGELDSLDVTSAMAATSEVMLEGCNIGIDLDGQRLLSVAVAAPLEAARRYAAIVKVCVEAMLNNELEHQITQRRLQHEIDERKAIEAKLLANEARFRDFAESAAHWLWEMDNTLRFSYFSTRIKTYLGLEPTVILGKSRQEL
ncbi:MAG TPA: sugar diacid recognition domain-containing protein, partial [Motiliproteus sp.]